MSIVWKDLDAHPGYDLLENDLPVPNQPALPRCRAIYWVFQLVVAAFALYGLTAAVELKLGRISRTTRLTSEALQQAGWTRPPLASSSNNTTLRSNSSHPPLPASQQQQLILHEWAATQAGWPPTSVDSLHLLILTPLKNAADALPNYFNVLEGLIHPKANTSLGFLIGDEQDDSAAILSEWAHSHSSNYRRVSLLRKDFQVDMPSGDERHQSYRQDQRRSIMARARTMLVTATLEPSVDWVLWLDSDVLDVPSSLFADLLKYGNAGLADTPLDQTLNDVVAPNIMTRLPGGSLRGFDANNWAETHESLEMQAALPKDFVLVEGNILMPTHRDHLVDHYVPANWSADPHFLPGCPPVAQSPINRYDPTSPAYIGRTMPLDAVGGVATLVRATTHRLGAFFPPWPIEHQLETEGFGVVARKVGARIVGLPNYVVLHSLQ